MKKSSTFFIDSNVFLRFFVNEKNKQHGECINFFETAKNNYQLLTCSVVILEVYFTLKSFYKYNSLKCSRYISQIINARNLKLIDDFNYLSALDLMKRKNVKFADCLIASMDFFQKGGVIVSYDKDFDKLRIKRLEPKDLI